MTRVRAYAQIICVRPYVCTYTFTYDSHTGVCYCEIIAHEPHTTRTLSGALGQPSEREHSMPNWTGGRVYCYKLLCSCGARENT